MNMKELFRWQKRLEGAKERISRVFSTGGEGVAPLVIFSRPYHLFGASEEEIPAGYCGEDPSIMLQFQVEGIRQHLKNIKDDYAPYLVPWYGTGVLASGFGSQIEFPPKGDPVVKGQVIREIENVKRLKIPNPAKDGLMPRVLQTIDFMRKKSDLPVGITDCQGPLTTALSLAGHQNLFLWMYDYPEIVHELFSKITQALINWVKLQKEHIGEEYDEIKGGAQGVWIPPGCGIWMSDDDAVLISPELYGDFVVPYNSQILQAFGSGIIHFCGNANHQIDNFMKTNGLRALNVYCLGDIEGLARLQQKVGEKLCIIACDFAPYDIEEYYSRFFQKMIPRRLIILSSINSVIALRNGEYVALKRGRMTLAKKVESIIRKKLVGEKS